MDRLIHHRVGRFVVLTAVGLLVGGYGAYRLFRTDQVSAPKVPIPATQSSVPALEQVAATPAPEEPLDLIEISGSQIDFGRVPTHYSLHQPVTFFNRGAEPVRIEGIRVEEPFAAAHETLLLPPGVRTELDIKFSPSQPGTYERRVALNLGPPVNGVMALVLRGEAVLSPEDAGVPIPPPPDQVTREHQQREIARMVAEARAALGDGSAAAGDAGGDASAEGERASARKSGNASGSFGGEGGPSMPYPVVLAAFGQYQSPEEDPNRIPVPIPSDEMEPDLPPADTGDEGAAPEDEGQGKDEKKPEAEKIRGFTVAPNSLVAVHSSQEPLQLQSFPVSFSPDGAAFQVDGRIKFPGLALAFGQSVEVAQWGNLVGSLAPDGSMQMALILRLQDPGEAVLDLPITLTTGMAVGYSAGGRVMFANGVPRNPATGDFKAVGITNIPVGAGSALDKAPVYVELLGRLEQ